MKIDATRGDSTENCELLRHVYAEFKHSHSLFTFTRVAAGKKNESFTTISFVREGIHKRMSWKWRSGEEIIALFVPTKGIRQCKYLFKKSGNCVH